MLTQYAVEQLRINSAGSKSTKLVAWFPTPEKQKKIECADADTKATFTAETLGHFVKWVDATTYLHIYRP